MSATSFLEAHTIPYLHVFVRVSGIFAFAPLFSMMELSLQTKGWMAAAIALVLYPLTAPYVATGESWDMKLVLLMLDDALIGVFIGLILSVYYAAFLMAGEFFSLQIGFGIINVIDPMSQTSIPILGQVKSLFALMIFVILNGHHMVIEAVVYSFRVLPSLGIGAAQPLAAGFIVALREMFVIAFQLSAPVVATVFLIELVMGIMSKVAPQMNVMVIGFQIKIVAGIGVLYLLIPSVARVSDNLFDRAFVVMRGIMRWM